MTKSLITYWNLNDVLQQQQQHYISFIRVEGQLPLKNNYNP